MSEQQAGQPGQSAAAPPADHGPARGAVPDHDEASALADVFKLLGDSRRVRLLYALLAAGELCVGDLAATVESNESTVSQAMRILRTAGVVRNRRAGRLVYYRLDDDHITGLLELSRDHVSHLED